MQNYFNKSLLLSVLLQIAVSRGQNVTNKPETEVSETTTKIPTTSASSTSTSTDEESETTTVNPAVLEAEEDEIEKFKEAVETGSADIVIVETGFDNPGFLPLPPKYNKEEIPPSYGHSHKIPTKTGKAGKGGKEPYKVAVFINIRGINSIDITHEKITLDLDLYTFWADRRFHGSTNNSIEDEIQKQAEAEGGEKHHKQILVEIEKLHSDFVKKIWTPDIIIENTVVIPHNDLTSEPVVSYNTETGFVKYTRLEVSAPCPMHYFYYPLDTQKCEITLRSYKYLNEVLNLHWANQGVFMSKPKNHNYDIQVQDVSSYIRDVKSLHFPNLLDKVAGGHILYGEKSFDVLRILITLRRNVSFHLFQTYLPSGFLVTITWLCFILPPGMAASKVGITMTALLTLNTMFSAVRTNSPQVTYAKAIDVWMIATLFFAFLSLVEFALYSWLEAVKEREEKRSKEYDEEMKKLAEPVGCEICEADNVKLMENKNENKLHVAPKISPNIKRMDPIKLKFFLSCRKFLQRHGHSLVIVVFCLFNLIYWNWICLGSEYFDWTINPKYNELGRIKNH